jgi:Cu+-exporting ATPase
MAIDLVCKMDVNENAAKPSVVFDGKKYLFCSEGCRAEFERHPEEYSKPAVTACCDASGKEQDANV